MKSKRYMIRICLLGAALLALGSAVQAQSYSWDGYDYFINHPNTNTISIYGYNGSGGDVTIPSTIGNLLVTSIGGNTFFNDTNLTSVTIPVGVTSIGQDAFAACYSLTSVSIPNGVTSIGEYAFEWCTSLTSVMIPGSVTNIGDGAFYDCSSLTSVTISNGVPSIGQDAFGDCSSLTDVRIPGSVTSLGQSAFEGCSNLTSVTISNGVTSIGVYAFEWCINLTSVTIPNSVTSIGVGAFWNCASLTLVTIGNSITNFGDGAFADCSSLINVTIGNGVTSIGENAFGYCTNLTSVTIPSSVTSIAAQAFFYCSRLSSVTMSNGVTSIGEQAFEYCTNLASVTIPGSLTNIGEYAFYQCSSLTNVAIPASLTNIGVNAFYECTGLTSVTISNGVTSIADGAFFGCSSLTSVAIPGSVSNIGNGAFQDCSSLTRVTIPGSVISIEGYAFDNCGLASVTISQRRHEHWGFAFSDCSSLTRQSQSPAASLALGTVRSPFTWLTNVCFEGNAPTNFTSNAFEGDYHLGQILYLSGATGWGSNVFGFTNSPCAQCGLATGSLRVTIAPTNAVGAGAHWTLDGGVNENSGVTVSNLSLGTHVVGFTAILKSGWQTPMLQMVDISNGVTSTAVGTYTLIKPPKCSLTITSPTNGQDVSNMVFKVKGTAKDTFTVAGVYVELNGGGWMTASSTNDWTNWTANVTLLPGTNTIGAYALDTSGIASTPGEVGFKFIPSATLVVVTNGSGTITPNDSGQLLAVGANYLTAKPNKNNFFSNWVGGVSLPYSVLSANPVYKFAMKSNLVLEANFVTNIFLAAQGAYNGLFAPDGVMRQQTNSGSFTLNLLSTGAFSGDLFLGSNTVSLVGKFDLSGHVQTNSTVRGGKPLTAILQLDVANQAVSGSVSDGSFVAQLDGDQNVFRPGHPASDYAGQYNTWIIPGTQQFTGWPLRRQLRNAHGEHFG